MTNMMMMIVVLVMVMVMMDQDGRTAQMACTRSIYYSSG